MARRSIEMRMAIGDSREVKKGMKCECCGKCRMLDGVIIKPDGENELDPCIYEPIEEYGNVTVTISRCINCGHIDISWRRQEDTVDLTELL